MKFSLHFIVYCLLMVSFGAACNNKQDDKSTIHFSLLPSSQTGITFTNTITENDSVNLLANEYAYTGGGVGIGDFNNDGLPDVYFGGNQVSGKLYINKGHFSFEDATATAGLTSSFWATGISIVDINNDGFDDIYVCASGSHDPERRKNRLYINNKNLTFSEQAAAYGLADTSFSTQAVFFDYDKDGDLDMYLVNHQLYSLNANTIFPPDFSGNGPAADRLYRNEGPLSGSAHPVYKDVSKEAGIKENGYGLGVVVSDLNGDNWPDIYVANDYVASDVLWLNNKNGTFSNRIASAVKHTSYSSMGVDVADINNDGLPDITSLDMLPEDNEHKKTMFSFMSNDRYEMEQRTGYTPAFMRNMLQLNNGVREVNDTTEPFFSEIGQLAGIFQTDWSWSVLMADFDNDGYKDMHITNGMGKDMLNNDYLFYRNNFATSGDYANVEDRNKKVVQKLSEYGTVALPNYCYKNNGNLTFDNISAAAGINTPSISNGAAYADLDNDGDIDLVINNINQAAFVLQNNAVGDKKDSAAHYLTIQLAGDSLNLNGFGAKVWVYAGGKMQLEEQNPVRGYFSSVENRLHFGVGDSQHIDSVKVLWPNDRQQIIYNIPSNSTLLVKQQDAKIPFEPANTTATFFTDVTVLQHIDFTHKETYFSDYDFQRLLPQKYSQLGPFTTSGDVNGDGLTDFFVGGAYNQSGRIFIQQQSGGFIGKDLEAAGKEQEDLGCLLFDADGDGDLDLFVNSGGFEYEAGSPNYNPRLYKNDGKGNFTQDVSALPKNIFTSAQCVAGADYDKDGDIDLFIGGRVSPSQYPTAPHSYLLQNNGGQFTDVTEQVCAPLSEAGMITATIWTDINNDQLPDLVIAGEWMPVRFFTNKGGRLEESTSATGLKNSTGQWRSLCAADIDGDGDMDIAAGNLGQNNKYRATPETPIKLFAKDMDGNGIIDPVLTYYITNKKGERKLYPDMGRDMLAQQLPSIKKKYLLHSDFSTKTADEILSDDIEDRIELTCEETGSVWLENKGNGQFSSHPLPTAAQIAPINTIICTDVDGDNKLDLILAGNEYGTEVMTGRYDASYGIVLKGNGKGHFEPVWPTTSGLIVDGDVKDMQLITTEQHEWLLILAINNAAVKAYRIGKAKDPYISKN